MPARSTLSLPRHASPQHHTAPGPRSLVAPAALRMQRALQAMQECRWRQAYEQLVPLADEGHPQASRMALMFAQRGTRLFGGHYEASASQRRAWALAAA